MALAPPSMASLYDGGTCREENIQERPVGTSAGHSTWEADQNDGTDLNRLRFWVPEMTSPRPKVGTLTPRWGDWSGPDRGLETSGNSGAMECPESGSTAVRDRHVMDAYHEMRILMTFSPDDSKKKGRIRVDRDVTSRNGSPAVNTLSCAETRCGSKESWDDEFHDCCSEMQLGLGGPTTPSSSVQPPDSEPCAVDDGRASSSATRTESGGLRDELLAAKQRIRDLEMLLAETQRENQALQDARLWSVDVRDVPEIASLHGLKKVQGASSGPVAKRSLHLQDGASVVF